MRWALRTADSATVERLAREAQLPSIVARLLVARGIETAEDAQRFLGPSLSNLHYPYLMKGLREAVERLQAAIERGETVLIYGDYDVDGTTAVVILKTVIELCGGKAEYHVPHRILEGYGMRDEVIERAAERGIRLIISVDTGIRAFAAGETAQRCAIDLIVTDHHLPQAEAVPKALAVVNPNQVGCDYPCKELCGAGVAFKIAQALLEATGRERLIPSFLKMVAIATIADAVPLVGENRIFAKLGLEGLRKPVNAGLRALLSNCELDGSRPLSAGDIAFRVAPRLNAAGRMDIADRVIRLFTERDPAKAAEMALELNQLNGDRQQREQGIIEEIHKKVAESAELRDAYCQVIDGEGWHRGIIGICATRVVERYHRPALVFSCEDGEAHGSGRSIPAFHLLEALESCPELFTRFGGHAHAVGCSLPTERLPELRARLDAFARQRLTPADFVPVMEYDAELALTELDTKLWDTLQKLEPYGAGNPLPVFVSRQAKLVQPPRILKEKHLKLRVAPENNDGRWQKAHEVVAWRMAERSSQEALALGDVLDLAFTIGYNDHPDFGGLQLTLVDFARGEKRQLLPLAEPAPEDCFETKPPPGRSSRVDLPLHTLYPGGSIPRSMQTSVAPEHCASCGSPALPDGDFCLFCGDVLTESGRHLAVKLGSSTTIVPITEGREFAGFWRRVWAGTIDVTLEIVVALLIALLIDAIFKLAGRAFGIGQESAAYVTGFTFIVLLAVGGWLYAALSESSHYRATIGKRIMHLQVVNSDGGKLNFGQASARHVMKFLSLFTLGIGFLMAGFTKRSQALHDLPTDCLVIHVPEESFSLFGKHF